MKIIYTPQRRDDACDVSISGDVLTINGEALDFSAIPEGATLPRGAVACGWLASDVERIAGALHLTLIEPQGSRLGPQQETRT
jgi:hypothetical protein